MKLFKPTLAVALLSSYVYAGCADEELEPARRPKDAGSDTTTTPTPGSDAGGTVDTDSAVVGTDSSVNPGMDSSTPKDTGVKDAPNDAKKDAADAGDASNDGGVDAALAAQCTAYCTCMSTTCPSEIPANCQSACVANTTWALQCRIDHCGLAVAATDDAGVTLHCGHAQGNNATCQ